MTEKNPVHPGEILKDPFAEVGWTTQEFADRLGVSRNTVSRLLNGHCRISPNVALALERIGWSNADFWMRLQAEYDLAAARRALSVKS
jgi:addiction module HigA family antidote